MKNKTDDILKKAANEFELKTGSGSWSAVSSALQGIERRGRVFQWGAFVSVFIGLMFVGKYLNPNETVKKEAIGNRQLANAQSITPDAKTIFEIHKPVSIPALEISGQPTLLSAIECPHLQVTNLPQIDAKFEVEFLKINPTTAFEKPRKGGSNKKLRLELFASAGMTHRTIFEEGVYAKNFSNAYQQPGTPQHRPSSFISIGATVSKQLNKRWNIATGLWLSKYGYAIYASDIHKKGSNTLLGQYTSCRVEVPLLADYKLNLGKAELELRQGLLPALTVAQSSPLADNYAYYSDNSLIPRLQVSALFNPRLKINLGKAELLVGPEFRYSLTNSYPNKHLLQEHLWSASLNVAMRVKI